MKHGGCCSAVKSFLTLCSPMDCSMPGFSVLHYLLEFAYIHVLWVADALYPSHPLLPSSLLPSIFPSIRVFSNDLLFESSVQSIGASTSASVLPKNIQGWLPLVSTGLIPSKLKGKSNWRWCHLSSPWCREQLRCIYNHAHVDYCTGKRSETGLALEGRTIVDGSSFLSPMDLGMCTCSLCSKTHSQHLLSQSFQETAQIWCWLTVSFYSKSPTYEWVSLWAHGW